MNKKITKSNFDSIYNVKDFGAVGDGKFDNTQAFNNALSTAEKNGGGIVFVPAGNYLFKGHINIPIAVTLQGTFSYATSHDGFKRSVRSEENAVIGEHGTILMPTADKGTEDAEAFITINTNAALKGLVIYYPEQIVSYEPYKYPWAVAMRGCNAAIIDVELLNPYNAIDANNSPRHYICRVYGQPLRRGIYIDGIHDIGRIEDIHFNPFWDNTPPINDFMTKNGEAFLIGRCDWEYMVNCFAIFYKTGFIFDDFGNGKPNVLLTQCGHDESPSTVIINQTQYHSGVSFDNCQMMGELYINETNEGPVKFSNCGFWGTPNGRLDQIGTSSLMNLKGNCHVTINGCHFYGWDSNPNTKGSPAINVDCESSTITYCNFIGDGREHIHVGENAQKCIIMGNKFNDGIKIKKENESSVEEAFNFNIS